MGGCEGWRVGGGALIMLIISCYLLQKIEALENRMFANPLHKSANLEKFYLLCQKKAEVSERGVG